MSTSDKPVVIVGSGLAGYTVARWLRELDKQRPVVMITADGGEVYSKPLLSNALAKGQTPDTLVQKSADARAGELNITLLTRCRVRAIDPKSRTLDTDQGKLAYDRLVLATGANQRRIIPEGAESGWIDTVNSLDDYRDWHGKLTGPKKILLIGAGLIGCEFADDLMSKGHTVEVVDPAHWPLSRLLPEAMGQALAAAMETNGARLRLGRYVTHLARDAGGFIATLNDGGEARADLVLSAVGLAPETTLAEAAGLLVEQGIVVDRRLCSSDPYIHALGDCAETPAGVMPYILPLMAEAKVLGQILAGQDVSLSMKAMPVQVKTTSLPLVVCPPRPGARGGWFVEGEGRDLTALFHEAGGLPLGFALSGQALAKKLALAKQMPALLD